MFWIVGGAILVLSLPGLLNIKAAPFEMLANLRPQLAAAALLFGLAGLGVGRHWVGAAAVAIAIALLCLSPELFTRASERVERPNLKVLWVNVFKDDRVVERVARLAQAEHADVVILAEPPRNAARTTATLQSFTYEHGVTDPDLHGTVIYSRHPISAADTRTIDAEGSYPLTSGTIAGVRIVALHPPVALTQRWLNARNAMLAAAGASATGGCPALIVGDMNAAPWSDGVRRFRSAGGLRPVNPGPGSTWFSPFPILGLPIDQAFTSPGLDASAWIGPGVGSDHLPLIISVARAPQAGGSAC